MAEIAPHMEAPGALLRQRWALLVLLVLPWILYGTTIYADFFFLDDQALFWSRNPVIHQGQISGLLDLWTTRYQGYTPLMHLSVWIDHALNFEGNPWLVRSHSLLWGSLCAIGTYQFLIRLTDNRAFAFVVAAVFICHPLFAPCLLWPAMRRKLIFITCMFWGLSWLFRAWRTTEIRPAIVWCIAGVLACVAGVLGNFHGVIAAPLVLLLGLGLAPELRRRPIFWISVVAVGVGVLAYVIGELLHMGGSTVHGRRLGGSFGGTLLADGPILLRYLASLVYPWRLTFYYGVDEDPNVLMAVGCWLIVALIVMGTVWIHHQPRRALLWWASAGVSLLPAFNLTVFPFAMADHYFLPSAFFIIILLAEIVHQQSLRLERFRPGSLLTWPKWVCVLSLLYLVPGSLMRISTFTDPLTATSWAIKVQPHSGFLLGYHTNVLASLKGSEGSDLVGATAVAALSKPDIWRYPEPQLYAAGMMALTYLNKRGPLSESMSLIDVMDRNGIVGQGGLNMLRGTAYLLATQPERALDELSVIMPVDQAFVDAIWERCEAGNRVPVIAAGGFGDSTNMMQVRSGNAQGLGDDVDLWNQRVMIMAAQAYAQQNRYLEAAKMSLAAIAINTRFVPAWTLLAECQALIGNMQGAGLAAKGYKDLSENIVGKASPRADRMAMSAFITTLRPRGFTPVDASTAPKSSGVK